MIIVRILPIIIAFLLAVLAALLIVPSILGIARHLRHADIGLTVPRTTFVKETLGLEERGVKEPSAPKTVVPVQEEGIVSEEAPIRRKEGILKLDERFSRGEIDVDDYLRKRQELVSQLQRELTEPRHEVVEMDKEELEILRLLSEKKTATEICLRLLKEPDQVKRTIERLVDQGLLNPDLSLTKKGVGKLFG